MAPGGPLDGVTECIIAYGTRIYTVQTEYSKLYQRLADTNMMVAWPQGDPWIVSLNAS